MIIFCAVLAVFGVSSFSVYKSYLAKHELVSPVLGVSKQLTIADNLWFPLLDKFTKDGELKDLSAKAALFVETNSGQVLYEKNSREKLPIASLTKIMTVIVTLENESLNREPGEKEFGRIYQVSERAANMEPDKMLLVAGERLTTEELLDGIFLVSANDAAEVFAERVTGRREEFINLMNSKARQLGMEDTLFINPTGLEEDEPDFPPDSGHSVEQYSSAYDVSLMSRYAIRKWPHLTDISSAPHIYLSPTSTHQDYDLYSGINLLTTYPGVVGFKTGYTPDAGLTLVTIARRGDKEVLGVILGATNRRDDAKMLLDYSFNKLGL